MPALGFRSYLARQNTIGREWLLFQGDGASCRAQRIGIATRQLLGPWISSQGTAQAGDKPADCRNRPVTPREGTAYQGP